ncbi:MAG TPA: cupin domain-containing protein [Capillimicrobium sp.]
MRHGTEDGPGPLLVDLHIAPGGHVAGQHVHAALAETFTVVSGTVGIVVDGVRREARPGDITTVPPGTAHDWWNAGDDEAHVAVQVDGPAEAVQRFEDVIVLLFGLAHEGRVDAQGMPDPLQLAVAAVAYRDVIRFEKPPRAVQRFVLPPLAVLGRALGRRPSYPHHRALVVS